MSFLKKTQQNTAFVCGFYIVWNHHLLVKRATNIIALINKLNFKLVLFTSVDIIWLILLKMYPRKKSCKVLVQHTLDIIVISSDRINIFFLIASAPTFALNQLKKTIIVTKGREVLIECKPQGSPKPTISWKKGDKAIRENKRLEACFIIPTPNVKLFWSCRWYT